MEGTVRHRGTFTRREVLKASAALPLGVAAIPASADAYPSRPVKVVIPYPPAGGADTVGRLLFQKLGEMWGAQFVIDNRGGAGGTIAAARGQGGARRLHRHVRRHRPFGEPVALRQPAL